MVSQKTIKALDFDKVLLAIGKLCMSEDSAAALASRYPLVERPSIIREHARLRAITRAAEEVGPLTRGARIPSCMQLIHAPKAKIYTLEELALLRNALCSINTCAHWLDATLNSDDTTGLEGSLSSMPRVLMDTLCRFFDEQGTVRSENITELREVERRKLRVHKARGKVVEEFMHTHSAICVSKTPSLRDDRVVVAIQSSHKSDVHGIVHGTSAREKSVYIEIPQLYELNNETLRLREEERAVYYTLCLRLSEQVIKVATQLKACYTAFMEFDILYARYEYGRMTCGSLVALAPEVSTIPQIDMQHESSHIYLEQVCNPFVDQCSPLTFDFRGGRRQLVLTGPNAGGKTVALKTLGLCALMNQSAIPLPLRTDNIACCLMPVFETIDIVIGDAQDVEKGVSTFSSHMLQVALGVQAADTQKATLLLFDELCADTDDREGGALASALLEHLAHTNSTVCITTHSAAVKHYVITAKHGISCLAALRVTRHEGTTGTCSYVIVYNAVGMSEAVQVARSVGMPQNVLEHYEVFLRFFGSDYDGMIQALHHSHTQAEAVREQLQEKLRQCEKRAATLRSEEEALAHERRMYAQQTLLSGAPLLSRMRKTLERLGEMLAMAKHISDSPSCSHTELSELNEHLQQERRGVHEFEKDLAEFETCVREGTAHAAQEDVELRLGDSVMVLSHGIHGTVLSVSKDKRNYRVQAGVVTLNLARKDVAPLPHATETQEAVHGIYEHAEPPALSTHVDLRGFSAAEAVERLEAHIDAALLRHRKVFSVIHGKGRGVLMRELHHALKNHALVERAEYAEPTDGGAGKTYVYLK